MAVCIWYGLGMPDNPPPMGTSLAVLVLIRWRFVFEICQETEKDAHLPSTFVFMILEDKYC